MENSNNATSGASNPYYVDLSGISKPNNIRTERDLEIEIAKICETLKDTCTSRFIIILV